MIFECAAGSCYSSDEFADAMTNAGNCYLLAGFSAERTCLATLVEASRHGHHVGFVEDASYSGCLPGYSAQESRRALLAVARQHATILTTKEWIEVAGTPRCELVPNYDNDE